MRGEFDAKMKTLVLCWVLMVLANCKLMQCSVSYDSKALLINGQRRLLISGSIHYPRSTPDMWEDLIMKAKNGGLDAIDTYVFWNGHEPSPGNYNFEGRYDLVRFLKIVQKAGLYAHLRLGPYVCAEWNFGGFPVWLKYVPGISFRTDNEPFKMAMQGFTEKIVNLLKSHNLFESQGGPIILAQIENEYGNLRKRLGPEGDNYMTWAAKMAVSTQTGVPWTMCKDPDTPDPLINTCNGFYCDHFTPNSQYKPKLWTEAWSGWFTEFGGSQPQRPVQDLAFAVARFIQSGGSFVNYYMYHGGTNFGRTAGGPFITCPSAERKEAAESTLTAYKAAQGDEASLQKAQQLVHSQNKDYVAVLFYASWCPFSRNFRPSFSTLSSLYPSIPHFAIEESSIRPSILSKYGVHGFPTLFLLNSTMRVRYRGSRSLGSLVAFYGDVTGIKSDPRDKLPLEKIESLSNRASNDNIEPENCPFSWARSPENLLRHETYLALATAFVFLRVLYLLFPYLLGFARSTWTRCVQNVRIRTSWEHPLRFLNRTKQLFSFVKDPRKGSNFQEGAINARAWASKSLASAVAIGDPSTSRGGTMSTSQ